MPYSFVLRLLHSKYKSGVITGKWWCHEKKKDIQDLYQTIYIQFGPITKPKHCITKLDVHVLPLIQRWHFYLYKHEQTCLLDHVFTIFIYLFWNGDLCFLVKMAWKWTHRDVIIYMLKLDSVIWIICSFFFFCGL